MNSVLDQLARTGLLPTDLAGDILAGNTPPTSEVVLHLVIAAMDAHAMTDGDPKSSWTERRISRQNLGLSFLVAMAIGDGFDRLRDAGPGNTTETGESKCGNRP